jgi:NhaP-type Na+/H+ or K+/H+ antiporter
MSAASRAGGAGLVFGLVAVLFAQQVGLLGLSDLIPGLERLVVGMVVGLVLGALIGWALGRRYLRRTAANAPA